MNEKLYHYTCLEAGKYFRNGYTMNYTLKAVKKDIQSNYITPSRIKIRLIGEETEEYIENIKNYKRS
jgi:hypothetical protein